MGSGPSAAAQASLPSVREFFPRQALVGRQHTFAEACCCYVMEHSPSFLQGQRSQAPGRKTGRRVSTVLWAVVWERKDVCAGQEPCNSTSKGREAREEVASKLGLEGDVDSHWAGEGGRGGHPRVEREQKLCAQEFGPAGAWDLLRCAARGLRNRLDAAVIAKSHRRILSMSTFAFQ